MTFALLMVYPRDGFVEVALCTPLFAEGLSARAMNMTRDRHSQVMGFHSLNNILGAGDVGANGVVNVTVTKGVTAIGSGEAGTPQVSVVPWARGSTSDSQTTDPSFTHLVSYDAKRGFRLLDPTKEFVTYEGDYEGSIKEENANVRVTAGNVVFSGFNKVNSLSTLASSPLTITATDGMNSRGRR